MTEATSRPSRRWMGWVIGTVVVIIIILILLPWILSWGIAQAVVRSQLDKSINGTIHVEGLALSWFGSQEIDHLVIKGDDGVTSIDVSVQLNRGLLSLIFSGTNPVRLDLSGAIASTIDQHGSLSLTDLMRDSSDKDKSKKDESDEDGGLTSMPTMAINVHDLSVTLTELPDKRVFEYDIAKLDVNYEPGGSFLLKGNATTKADGQDGSITLSAVIKDLVSSSGALTPKQATMDVDVDMTSVGLPLTPPQSYLQDFKLRMTSDDLSKRMVIDGTAAAQLADSEATTFEANLVVKNPIVKRGSVQAFSFSPANLAGTLEGKNLPTALAQPFVANSPLQLNEDIGTTIDVSGTFSSADAPQDENATTSASDAGSTYTVSITSAQLQGNLTGKHDVSTGGGSGKGSIELALKPATVKRLANVDVDQDIRTKVELKEFIIPASVSGDGLENMTANGSFKIVNKFNVSVPQDKNASPVQVSKTLVTFDAKGLGESLSLKGGSTVGGGSIAVDLNFDELLKEDGSLKGMPGVIPVGTVTLKDIPTEIATSVEAIAASIHSVNGEQLLGETISMDLSSTGPNFAREIDASVTVATGTANGRVQIGPIGVSLLEANVDVTLTPEMAVDLQKPLEEPFITLSGPAHLSATMEPFAIDEELTGGLAPLRETIKVTFTLDEVAFSISDALPDGVELRRTKASVSYEPTTGGTIVADVSTRIRREQGGQVADLATSFTLKNKSDGSKTLSSSADLTSINTPNLEKAMGLSEGRIALWTGDSGTLKVQSTITLKPDKKKDSALSLSKAQLELVPTLEHLNGRAEVSISDESITVTSPGLKTVLSHKTLGDVLERDVNSAAAAGSSQAAQEISVTDDVPLSLQIDALELPLSMFSSEESTSADVHIDLTANMSQISIKSGDGSIHALNPIKAHFATRSLAEGIVLKATTVGGSGSGTVDISGTIERLTNRKGRWTPHKMQIDLHGTITQVPTVLLDSAADLRGILTASLGNLVSGTLSLDNLSGDTGSLTMDLKSTNAEMTVAMVNKDGVLRADPDAPLKGHVIITPLLRTVVLSRMGPILGDIDAGEEPLRLTWADAAIPINGKPEDLGGKLNITVGEVTFDSGLPLMLALSLAQSSRAEQIKGSIDPITATIDKGVMTYAPFSVHVDKFNFPIAGTINFVTGEIDMTTRLPIYALGDVIAELRPYVSDEEVPMEYVGPIGKAKWKLSTSFDLARFILRATLENTLRRRDESN